MRFRSCAGHPPASELWKQVGAYHPLAPRAGGGAKIANRGGATTPPTRPPMTSAIGHQGTTSTWTVETGLIPAICCGVRCERILCVGNCLDQLLEIQRQLDCDLDFVIAACAEEGLAALAVEAPFDVIITCLQLPGNLGAVFNARLRQHSPDAERLILAPCIDAQAKAAVANDARVMRLLLAPCSTTALREAVADALLRHRARRLRAAVVPRSTPPGGNPCAG